MLIRLVLVGKQVDWARQHASLVLRSGKRLDKRAHVRQDGKLA